MKYRIKSINKTKRLEELEKGTVFSFTSFPEDLYMVGYSCEFLKSDYSGILIVDLKDGKILIENPFATVIEMEVPILEVTPITS